MFFRHVLGHTSAHSFLRGILMHIYHSYKSAGSNFHDIPDYIYHLGKSDYTSRRCSSEYSSHCHCRTSACSVLRLYIQDYNYPCCKSGHISRPRSLEYSPHCHCRTSARSVLRLYIPDYIYPCCKSGHISRLCSPEYISHCHCHTFARSVFCYISDYRYPCCKYAHIFFPGHSPCSVLRNILDHRGMSAYIDCFEGGGK